MGRKARIPSYKLVTAHSLAASFQSASTTVDQMDSVSYLIDVTGVTDNTGSFGVQVRTVIADTNPSSPTASAWTSLTLANTPTLANAAAQFELTINDVNWDEMRITFTAAGTVPDGVCNVYVTGKQLGG